MAVQENDIGLVSFEEFNDHQNNEDSSILHVTAAEKTAWNGKANNTDLSTHKTAEVIDHPDGSVTTDKIANEAITPGKLNSEIQNLFTQEAQHRANTSNPHSVGAAQVGLGNVDNVQQASKTEFNTHKTADTLDHPDGSVKTQKIADGAINAAKIASNAVTAPKIADGAVVTSKLGVGSATEEKIADGAVTADKLGNDAVTEGKIATGAVTSDKVANGAIGTGKIADDAVTADKLADSVNADIASREVAANKGQPQGYAPLDTLGKIPNDYLYGKTVKEYGVRWKGTSSTVCDRLGDAIGLTANAHLGTTDTVQNDFDSIYPWSDMKLCNIDVDGNVLAYNGEPTFAKDGTNGDVMVEIPKFYYKRNKTSEGYEEWWICSLPLDGYQLHPLFINDGAEVSKVYHSAYNVSTYTDAEDGNKVKAQSITGVQPKVRATRANFRTYARNKGANWSIEDVSCMNALQMLYLIEYANTNSQLKLGSGVSNLSYTANHKALDVTNNDNFIIISSSYKNVYKIGQRIEIGTSQGSNNKTATPRTVTAIATDEEAGTTTITFDGDPVTLAVGNMIWNVAPLNGSCDNLNGESGYIGTSGYADTSYRGIEGFHGKLYRFIDGVNINERVVYYANSASDYADGVYTGKYRAAGYTNGDASGYVSAFGYDPKAPWVMFPTAAVGGSTTYVPDYYYQNTGERLLLLGGGFFYSGSGAGVFSFSCSNTFSFSYLYYGAHLLIKKP